MTVPGLANEKPSAIGRAVLSVCELTVTNSGAWCAEVGFGVGGGMGFGVGVGVGAGVGVTVGGVAAGVATVNVALASLVLPTSSDDVTSSVCCPLLNAGLSKNVASPLSSAVSQGRSCSSACCSSMTTHI